jgi:hypothetical protein
VIDSTLKAALSDAARTAASNAPARASVTAKKEAAARVATVHALCWHCMHDLTTYHEENPGVDVSVLYDGWKRCDQCPMVAADLSFVAEREARLGGGLPRLCSGCRSVAYDSFDATFTTHPHPGYPMSTSVAATYYSASWDRFEAEEFWLFEWPQCNECYNVARRAKDAAQEAQKSEDERLASALVATLRTEGELGTDALTAAVKGLDKNNRSRVLKAAVKDGSIIERANGPAKFYRAA